MSSRTPHVVNLNDEPLINWLNEPVFEFPSEVDALEMLLALREELEAAREQVRHCMRYMSGAIQAARKVTEDGERVSKQAIIGYSGLARQTVYNILGEDD